eukprot:CAMPEP_0172496330 /NCGR_PEP_ID=MMETSP1066-20121228/85425_1 /TAXON_ID=671091 /ORGANISM="Coscinodiscus wailesii, Strain CCMP2513" /LENGTH=85 /DNA_ID=CAMNT_0013268575 /DNA_START=155 /DNA_END=412 /DNA_ORIENTATION=+
MAHVLFWIYGFGDLKTYGYKDTINPEIGNIPSGPQGSGVVVVSLSLMIAMTVVWFQKLCTHRVGKGKDIGIADDDTDHVDDDHLD